MYKKHCFKQLLKAGWHLNAGRLILTDFSSFTPLDAIRGPLYRNRVKIWLRRKIVGKALS